MIVLIGFMGAGKSTIGQLLATKTGLPFVDTDALIERRAGAPIREIFVAGGEAAFRELEGEVVAEVLAGPDAVVALGGGALEDPATSAAVEWATVVHLEVDFEEAMRRVGSDADRPMLNTNDPKELFDRRRAKYARAARISVTTDGKTPEEVAGEIASAVGASEKEEVGRVVVPLGDRSYPVIVGAGIAARLADLVELPKDASRAWLVTHDTLDSHAAHVEAALSSSGLQVSKLTVPDGERSKSPSVAAELYEKLAAGAAHRGDLVVAVGGGVVCDLAGFVASTYNRGMRIVHVPTTLLAQVDAAIGGKTGVNLGAGKNLVGTIHQPVAVLCDVDLLATLPEAELRSGAAEVVKYGFIAEPDILELVRAKAAGLMARDRDLLVDIVLRCATVKAAIVGADEHEHGVRAHLNYGHTFAHGIEQTGGFETMRHGEAVAVGMMAAAHLAHDLGRIPAELVDMHRETLTSVGLPTSATLDLDGLQEAWQRDKKYRGEVRFVLLAGLGRPEAGVVAPRDAVARALDALAKSG